MKFFYIFFDGSKKGSKRFVSNLKKVTKLSLVSLDQRTIRIFLAFERTLRNIPDVAVDIAYLAVLGHHFVRKHIAAVFRQEGVYAFFFVKDNAPAPI